MNQYESHFWFDNGFEELRRYAKHGTDFCKELESIMVDRSELEKEYYSSLHKIAKKAKKAAAKCVGATMVTAWQRLTDFLDKEEEIHRDLSINLAQDCARPIKVFTDQQIKQREPVEAAVEKQSKAYAEKQRLQIKLKKAAHKQFKEMELSWDQLDAMKRGEGRPTADKDIQKFEKSCRKMEESLTKVDREFQDSNVRTEEARLGWETAMYRFCQTLESLENERLIQISTTLSKYSDLLSSILPSMEERCKELTSHASGISPSDDIRDVCVTMGTGPNQPEQLLLDCYEIDLQNPMNMERRRTNLERKIQEMEEEIERRKKARQGLESLSKAYNETPDFCDEQGHNDVARQLAEADAMLNLLNANHYKLLCAQAECSNFPKPTNPHAEFIQSQRDKNGSVMTVLKIPLDYVPSQDGLYAIPDKVKKNSLKPGRPPPMQNSTTPRDDFESSDEHGNAGKGKLEFSEPPSDGASSPKYIAMCRVEYDYTPNQPDELLIHSGDMVNVIEKQDQDWWKGELNGNIGIFPASYVVELS